VSSCHSILLSLLNFGQNFILTNDLNDRDTEILAFKKREAELSQTILSKEKMYEQDAMVRMQLGKRLEQVLMDKEEAVEQLDALRDQLEAMKTSIAVIQQGAKPQYG
jgi:hypothetical protein